MLWSIRTCLIAFVIAIDLIGVEGTAQTSYTVAARPALTLAQYDSRTLLGRIAGAVTLSDGSVVVADAGSMALYFFTSDGKPKAAFGRQGSGPGEFRSMIWMGSCGRNAVSLFDPVQNRVTTVDAAGKLSGVSPARPQGPVGYFPDQRSSPAALVCSSTDVRLMVGWPTGAPPTKPGPYRADVNVAYSVGGEPYKRLGSFAGPERVRYPKADGPRKFGKTLLVAASSNRLFVGTADSFHVSIYGLDGRKAGDIRLQRATKRFKPEDKERFKTTLSWRRPGNLSREQLNHAVDTEELPELLPAYGRFLIDDANRLWVEEAYAPSEQTRRWWGFNDSGELVGSITVPAALQLYEIRSSSVLGKWTAEDGEEGVRRYQLVSQK